jgi:hypothetical protein
LGRLLKITPMTLPDLAIAGVNAGLALVANNHLKNRERLNSGNENS